MKIGPLYSRGFSRQTRYSNLSVGCEAVLFRRLFGSVDKGCGDGGLAVAKSAIAWTDAGMLVHLKAFGFKLGAQEAGEAPVVHHASAHGDGADSYSRSRRGSHAHETVGNGGVEARGDPGFTYTAVQIVQKFLPQRRDLEPKRLAGLSFTALLFDLITVDVFGLADGDAFEFDGGLRFVIDGAAIQYNCRDGIEKPPEAGCERRI